MRIYLDSNVFISLFQVEVGMHKRGLFVEAGTFIEKVKENEHLLVLSNWFFDEINRHHFTKEDVLKYLEEKEITFELVEEKQKQDLNEFTKKGIHYSDAVHIAIALKHKCDCIVTFNSKDFNKIKDKIQVFEPNEF
ncbi:MAG: type II toxin-antitoxin system VapC family toxin [Candidatus Diapherotrites archaeon]